jgi:hypothetical protein
MVLPLIIYGLESLKAIKLGGQSILNFQAIKLGGQSILNFQAFRPYSLPASQPVSYILFT